MRETGLLQNAEMPRYAGLIDIDVLHDIVDRMLTAQQHFNDAEPGWVGQDLERR